jgi:hypothetical protein
MKFRQKPVVVEAVQFLKSFDHPSVSWVILPTGKGVYWFDAFEEGGYIVTPGDWIITSANGEISHCKQEVFNMNYEIVEDDPN